MPSATLSRYQLPDGRTLWQLGGRRRDQLEVDGKTWRMEVTGGVLAVRDAATAEVSLVCGECGQQADLERLDGARLSDDDVVAQLRHGLEHTCPAAE